MISSLVEKIVDDEVSKLIGERTGKVGADSIRQRIITAQTLETEGNIRVIRSRHKPDISESNFEMQLSDWHVAGEIVENSRRKTQELLADLGIEFKLQPQAGGFAVVMTKDDVEKALKPLRDAAHSGAEAAVQAFWAARDERVNKREIGSHTASLNNSVTSHGASVA